MFKCDYDAWNRLARVWQDKKLVAAYEYDGLGRRIVKRDFRPTWSALTLEQMREMSLEDWLRLQGDLAARHYYYSQSWQLLQERVEPSSGSKSLLRLDRQYVWGLRGPDDLILRDRDTDGDGAFDERIYALADAHGSVVSLYDLGFPHRPIGSEVPSLRIVERMGYDPYGRPRFMEKDFKSRDASAHDWNILFAGYHYDEETGLYHVRNRFYHPEYGRWLQTDPAGFQDSYNPYQYCLSSPHNFVDPTGRLIGLGAGILILGLLAVGGFGLYKARSAYNQQQQIEELFAKPQLSDDDMARMRGLWDQSMTDLGYAQSSLGIVMATGAGLGIGAGLGFIGGLGMYGAAISTGLGIGLTALAAPGLIHGGARLVSGQMSGPEAYGFVGSLGFGAAGGYFGARNGYGFAAWSRWQRWRPAAKQLFPDYMYWRRQGFSPAEAAAQAKLMSRPYQLSSKDGQHFITQARFKTLTKWISARLPGSLARPINAALLRYMNSPLNVVSGRNMTHGEFYKYHYMMHAGRAFGTRSWSGWNLGGNTSKYYWQGNQQTPSLAGVNAMGYILFSTPAPLTGLLTGSSMGGGGIPEF